MKPKSISVAGPNPMEVVKKENSELKALVSSLENKIKELTAENEALRAKAQ